MKRRKTLAAVLVTALVLAAFYVIVPGFIKQGGAFIGECMFSEDGTEMTFSVGVASSIGYVRKVSAQQQGGKLYLTCYSAFGGFNGSLGAKQVYTVSLDPETEVIAVYRSADCYQTVFEKDAAGVWQRV